MPAFADLALPVQERHLLGEGFALKLGDAPRVLVFRLLGGDGTESYWIRSLRRRS